jgi:hypothetical protein
MSNNLMLAAAALAALALAGCNKTEEAPAEAPAAVEAAPAAEEAPAADAMAPAADAAAPAADATAPPAEPEVPTDDRGTNPVNRGGRS